MFYLHIQLESVRMAITTARGKTAFNKAVNQAGEEVARYWIDHYLLKHFDEGAYQRYRYAARTPRWNRIKRQEAWWYKGQLWYLQHPPRPLVFTGEMERHVMRRMHVLPIEAKAGAYGGRWNARVKVKISIPHALNPKNKGELKRVNPSEWRYLKWMWWQGVQARIKRDKIKIVKKIA